MGKPKPGYSQKDRPLNYTKKRSLRNAKKFGDAIKLHESLLDEKDLSLHKLIKSAKADDAKTQDPASSTKASTKSGKKTSKKTLRKSDADHSIIAHEDALNDEKEINDILNSLITTSAPVTRNLTNKERRMIEKETKAREAAIDTGKSLKESMKDKTSNSTVIDTKRQLIKNRNKKGAVADVDLWSTPIESVCSTELEKKFVERQSFQRNSILHRSSEAPSGRIDRLSKIRDKAKAIEVDSEDALKGKLRNVKLSGDEAIISSEDDKTRRLLIPSEDVGQVIINHKKALAGHKYNVGYRGIWRPPPNSV